MSFTIDNLVKDGTFDVVLRQDPALEEMTDEEYEDYLKTMDESKLRLKGEQEPTRFTMLRKLKYAHRQWVDAAKIKVDKTGEMSLQLFEFMMREVRASLVGVKSPASVPTEKRIESVIKKTGDGLLSEEFAIQLGDMVGSLFNARQTYLESQKGTGADIKKG